jgi:hypothetical protein
VRNGPRGRKVNLITDVTITFPRKRKDVDTLLGKNRGINKYMVVVTVSRLRKRIFSHGNNWATTMRSAVFCAVLAEVL